MNVNSSWCKVSSGVPHGSILAPIMFIMCTNDIEEGKISYMDIFAGDAKLFITVKCEGNCKML